MVYEGFNSLAAFPSALHFSPSNVQLMLWTTWHLRKFPQIIKSLFSYKKIKEWVWVDMDGTRTELIHWQKVSRVWGDRENVRYLEIHSKLGEGAGLSTNHGLELEPNLSVAKGQSNPNRFLDSVLGKLSLQFSQSWQGVLSITPRTYQSFMRLTFPVEIT